MTARPHHVLLLVLVLAGCGLAVSRHARRGAAHAGDRPARAKSERAVQRRPDARRLAGRVQPASSVRAVPPVYDGAAGQTGRVSQGGARPLSLASADFDEDGVADVVGGYEAAGGGLLTLNRGNADALYPNSAEAQQHRADGSFTDAPLLSPGKEFALPAQPSFLGAGDFDGDGHWDVVAAGRDASALHVLRGDGAGNFEAARGVELPGRVTALMTGEVNRADGLNDIVVAVEGAGGAAALVFEGPGGALGAQPEIIPLPSAARSLAVGQLDGEPSFDMAFAAGRELVVVRGRDRKLSLDAKDQATVAAPAVEREVFTANVIAVAVGDFTEGQHHDLAVLTDDGALQLLSRAGAKSITHPAARGATEWLRQAVASGDWSSATRLASARTSGGLTEDVLILDETAGRMSVAAAPAGADSAFGESDASSSLRTTVALDAVASPAAVLPMQLDGDALSDLVLLRKDSNALAVSLTAGAASAAGGEHAATSAVTFQPARPGASGPQGLVSQGSDAHAAASAEEHKRTGATPGEPDDAPLQSSAPCGFADPITPGVTVNGLLGPGDCRFAISEEFFDRYTFNGFAGQRIAIAMVSTVFDPAIILTAPDGTRLIENDDSSDGTNSRIPADGGFITLPVTGVYIIDATTIYFDEIGPYQIGLNALGPNDCSETPIRSGNVFAGTLLPGDCGFSTGQRADVYSFFGAANQQVAVYMASGDIDSYLRLVSPSGLTIDDDDGGLPPDARIPPGSGTLLLPETGIYRIIVTSFGPNDFGSYQLELLVTGPTVVTNTNDSGVGSLRQAILNANADPNPNAITFAIGSGVRTISPLSPLPPVSGPTLIDGTTQPGFAGTPIIELNGAGAGIRAAGLKLTAGNSRVRGLVINRFTYGVAITASGGNTIDGNFIGTNVAGTAALGNVRNGLVIFSTAGNVIGGTAAAARNVISGNSSLGVEIGRNGSFNNAVGGNFIGTNAAGTAAVGNGTNGILIRRGTSNLVGGAVAGARNIISGNGLPGVAVGDTQPVGNLVQGNFIGTNAAGTAAIGNGGAGLIMGGLDAFQNPVTATNNMVGGTVVAARNVISGNVGQGVEINNLGSTGNQVQGNFIGTNAAGNAALGNQGVGVSVTKAPGEPANVIGGAASGAGNVISGNRGPAGHGVAIGIPRNINGFTITGGRGITVQNNIIGTDLTRTLRLGNELDGVFVDAQSVVNTVTGNVIAFNGRNGIFIPSNQEPGVRIFLDNNNVFGNGALGIDLDVMGVTPNDDLDLDGGANLRQNFPELLSAGPAGGGATARARVEAGEQSMLGTITVMGRMRRAAPNALLRIRWYFTNAPQCVNNQFPTQVLDASKQIIEVQTDAQGNAPFSFPFTFPPGVTSGVINCTATDVPGSTSELSECLPVVDGPAAATIQFSPATYTVGETGGSIAVTVARTGVTTSPVAVDYATSDLTATERRDYLLTLGRLEFAAGETQKTINVLVTDDVHVEPPETFQVLLSNPSAGAALGPASTANVTITSNDATLGANPIDDTTYFVKQQYRDFLNRDPDDGGLNFWRTGIDSCGANQQCREVKRVDTSAAFFLSIEFQETGVLVYRMYKAAFGDINPPGVPAPTRLREFAADTQQIGRGVVVGVGAWQQQLEANKSAYAAQFVARSRFTAAYPQTMTPAQFVDGLNAKAGGALNPAERTALVNALTNGSMSRAQVLRRVAEDEDFVGAELRRAFVLMQYFGYLRRNPDDPQDTNFDGYAFWLQKLNQFNGSYVDAEMVRAFVNSIEYRQRFGQ